MARFEFGKHTITINAESPDATSEVLQMLAHHLFNGAEHSISKELPYDADEAFLLACELTAQAEKVG